MHAALVEIRHERHGVLLRVEHEPLDLDRRLVVVVRGQVVKVGRRVEASLRELLLKLLLLRLLMLMLLLLLLLLLL